MSNYSRRRVYTGRVVDLGIERFTAPNGNALELEVVRHPGGAAIAAVNERQEVCLVRQYRHAAGGWLTELPAGKLEPGEPSADTARRELREEAGLEAAHWRCLGDLMSTPGFCDERIFLYLATELDTVGTAHEDEEFIEVFWQALGSACDDALRGEITDAKTVIGLLRARDALNI